MRVIGHALAVVRAHRVFVTRRGRLLERPQRLAGRRIQRHDRAARARRRDQHAVDVDRQAARVDLADLDAGRHVLAVPLPRDLQRVEVRRVDLVERRVAGRGVAAGDAGPVALLLCAAGQAGHHQSDRHHRPAEDGVGVHFEAVQTSWALDSSEPRTNSRARILRPPSVNGRRHRQWLRTRGRWYTSSRHFPRIRSRCRRFGARHAPDVSSARLRCSGRPASLAGGARRPARADPGAARPDALPRVNGNRSLALVVLGAGGGAAGVAGACWPCAPAGPASPGFIPVPPRAQHYVQSCCQLASTPTGAGTGRRSTPTPRCSSGSSSSPTPSTCCWPGRGASRYALGFGPFPIVFSTNLFLWFKDDWFLLQFVLIAVGFLGKAFVRWERDGKRVHIFNPSAFTLALFSLVLLVTGTTDIDVGAGDQHHLQPRRRGSTRCCS